MGKKAEDKKFKRPAKDAMNEEEVLWKTLKVIHPKTKKLLTKEENFNMKFGYLKKAIVLY